MRTTTMGWLLAVLAAACGADGKGDVPAAAADAARAEPSSRKNEPEPAAPPGEAEGPSPPPEVGTTGEAASPGTTGGPVPELTPEQKIEALMAEIADKKTPDERALAALGEAQALGGDLKALLKAADKKADKLASDPERASKFLEWARTADPKAAAPVFELAKIAANAGDIERVRLLLTEVKARKGKKLLATVEFDPTFALVADDPDVQALLR